jgi:hypothetical protein
MKYTRQVFTDPAGHYAYVTKGSACGSERPPCLSLTRYRLGATWDRLESEGPQLLEHALEVGGGPVDALAAGAAREALLSLPDIRRYAARNGVPTDCDQLLIAARAAGERMRKGVQAERIDDLTQLFSNMVAPDEQQRWGVTFTQEAPIAREDGARFHPRVSYQGATGQVRAIAGIEADDPQPHGEATEHCVDGETRGLHTWLVVRYSLVSGRGK